MKKTKRTLVLTLMCSLIFPFSLSFAECPPECTTHQFAIQSMSLAYDLLKTSLHIEADHHCRNEEGDQVDYINKMTVSLNGNIIITRHFTFQRDPDVFYEDVHFKAKSGDVISVELFSEKGNVKSLDLTLSDEIISETRSVDTESSTQIGL